MWTHVRSIALRRVSTRSIALSSSRQLVCHLGNTLTTKPPAFLSYPLSNPRFFTSLRTESEHPTDYVDPSDLKLEWKAIRSQLIDDPNNSENTAKLKDIIARADRNHDARLLIKVFRLLRKVAPHEITFETYGLMFRVCNRIGDFRSMINTYKTGIEYYGDTETSSIPELIYRFGVAGHLYEGYFDKADEILNAMDENGIQISNELHSIIMMTHAKAGNKDRVLSSYHALNPENGWWYQNVFDRVISSLGIIGEPHLAFDFYTNSRKELRSGTLRSLLQVCINNNCTEQAAKILENRKHFDLKLNTNAYNSILLALEFLNRQDEMESVLEEMRKSVRLDSLTQKIIIRNESVLNEELVALAHDIQQKRHSYSEPEKQIRKLIRKQKYAEALQLAEPLMEEAKMEHFKDPSEFVENAIYIHPETARTVLSALAHAKETKKLEQFLTHCNQFDASYRFALTSLAKFYRDQNLDEPNYTQYLIYRRLQDTDTIIFDTRAASDAFAAFNDVDALAKLYEQSLAAQSRREDHTISLKSDAENPDRERPLNWGNLRVSLQAYSTMLICSNRLEEFTSAMDQAIEAGFDLKNNFYVDLNYRLKALGQQALTENEAATTSKRPKRLLPIPRAAELLFTDMKTRSLPVNYKVIISALETLSFGNEYQVKMLLDLYQQLEGDEVVLPLYACCRLLSSIFTHGSGELSTKLFQHIRSHYVPSPETFMTKLKDKQGQVTERQIRLLAQSYYWHILKLTASKELDQAFDALQELAQLNLEIKYMPVVRVWNLALKVGDEAKADALSQLFETQNFKMNVYDACQFLRHIRANNDLERGLKVLDLFESANIEVNESTEPNESQDDTVEPKVSVRPKDLDGGQRQWNWRKTKEALSVYENVLELAEERGDAELVSHLQSRIEMLFPSVLHAET